MKNIVSFPERNSHSPEMITQEAIAWMVKLDADTPPDDTQRQALREWVSRSPVHADTLRKTAALWGQLNIMTELAVPLGKTEQSKTGVGWQTRFASFALVLTLSITGFLFWQSNQSLPVQTSNGLYATAVGQQSTTVLEDGSLMQLNTNSQAKVQFSHGFRDIQLLQGEAMFTVAKDPDKPFRVYAGDGRIQAIGTAFAVYLKDNEVNITVEEGRVALAGVSQQYRFGQRLMLPSGSKPLEHLTQKPDNDPAHQAGNSKRYDDAAELLGMLEAGQVGTLKRQASSMLAQHKSDGQSQQSGNNSKLEVQVESLPAENINKRLSWRAGVITFNGEPLGTVIKEIDRYTALSIEIADPELNNMPVGGRFPVGETEVMLQVIEASFGVEVTRKGPNHVVLSTKQTR